MNTAGKVVVGLMAGAATGAILGILFAPDKGSEIRRKISQRSKDIRYNFQNKVGEVLEKAAEKIEHPVGHNHGQKETAKAQV
jgi:gas vesicle protein